MDPNGINESELLPNHPSSFLTEETRPRKKRKLSMGKDSLSILELGVAKAENLKLKEYIKKLENEKIHHINECNGDKIFELEEIIEKLQGTIADLKAENEMAKNKLEVEMASLNSTIANYAAKIKMLEDQKTKSVERMKELNTENLLMKTIKVEVKDSVEEEREHFQAKLDQLKAEIIELKNHNVFLEQNYQNLLADSKIETDILKQKMEKVENEIKRLKANLRIEMEMKQKVQQKFEEERKKFQKFVKKMNAKITDLKDEINGLQKLEEEAKNLLSVGENKIKKLTTECQQLKEKFKGLEASNAKEKRKLQNTIEILKADVCKISATNKKLMDEKKELQSSIDDLKKNFEVLEKQGSDESQILSLNDVFDGIKLNYSLLSCKTILSIAKIEVRFFGWNFYYTTDKSEKPQFFDADDLIKTCFKLNIKGHCEVDNTFLKLKDIMHRINSCELTTLSLSYQKINCAEYHKLVSSKTIEICTLKKLIVFCENKNFERILSIDELLDELPNIKEFKYEFRNEEDQSKIAEKLSQLPAFSKNLQKFQLFGLSKSFKLEDFVNFILKNSKDVGYVFSFSGLTNQSKEEVQLAENKLLKSLPFSCNHTLKFE